MKNRLKFSLLKFQSQALVCESRDVRAGIVGQNEMSFGYIEPFLRLNSFRQNSGATTGDQRKLSQIVILLVEYPDLPLRRLQESIEELCFSVCFRGLNLPQAPK